MSTFRFRLERVLSWRQTELAAAEAELERLHSELRMLHGKLQDLAVNEAKETQMIQALRSLPGRAIAEIGDTRKWVAQERERLQARIGDCAGRTDRQTAVVTEARRKVRLLERLRERRHETWLEEENRALDELARESALGSWLRRENGTPKAERGS